MNVWTCFHCGETFTEAAAARTHFGAREDAQPGSGSANHDHHHHHPDCPTGDQRAVLMGLVAVDKRWQRELDARDAELAALRAKCERLRKDAERYQWLRSRHWSDSEVCCVADPRDAVRLGYSCPSLELLDDIIDAAMTDPKPAEPAPATPSTDP